MCLEVGTAAEGENQSYYITARRHQGQSVPDIDTQIKIRGMYRNQRQFWLQEFKV